MFHFLGIAHLVLDLGEGLLDRVEVRRIGRQEPQPGAGASNRLSDRLGLVAGEIVEDDDVAGLYEVAPGNRTGLKVCTLYS